MSSKPTNKPKQTVEVKVSALGNRLPVTSPSVSSSTEVDPTVPCLKQKDYNIVPPRGPPRSKAEDSNPAPPTVIVEALPASSRTRAPPSVKLPPSLNPKQSHPPPQLTSRNFAKTTPPPPQSSTTNKPLATTGSTTASKSASKSWADDEDEEVSSETIISRLRQQLEQLQVDHREVGPLQQELNFQREETRKYKSLLETKAMEFTTLEKVCISLRATRESLEFERDELKRQISLPSPPAKTWVFSCLVGTSPKVLADQLHFSHLEIFVLGKQEGKQDTAEGATAALDQFFQDRRQSAGQKDVTQLFWNQEVMLFVPKDFHMPTLLTLLAQLNTAVSDKHSVVILEGFASDHVYLKSLKQSIDVEKLEAA